jgi:hypothetical protein
VRSRIRARWLALPRSIHTLGVPAGATLSAFGISLRRFTGSTVARESPRTEPPRPPKLEKQQARALVASEREQHIAEVDRRAPAINRHLGGRQQQLAQAHRGTDGHAERVTVRPGRWRGRRYRLVTMFLTKEAVRAGAPERSPRAPSPITSPPRLRRRVRRGRGAGRCPRRDARPCRRSPHSEPRPVADARLPDSASTHGSSAKMTRSRVRRSLAPPRSGNGSTTARRCSATDVPQRHVDSLEVVARYLVDRPARRV